MSMICANELAEVGKQVGASNEQKARVDAVFKFGRDRLSPGARRRDAEAQFDRPLWDEAASFGLVGLPIPEKWGGSGLDVVETMEIVEALGKSCEDGGLVFSLCAHMFASAVPVWLSNDYQQHERYLSGMTSGKLICANGATEPHSGSDVYAMKSRARRSRQRIRALWGEVLRHQCSRCRLASAICLHGSRARLPWSVCLSRATRHARPSRRRGKREIRPAYVALG